MSSPAFDAGVIAGLTKTADTKFRAMRFAMSPTVLGGVTGGLMGAAVSPSDDRSQLVIPGIVAGALLGKRLSFKKSKVKNARKASAGFGGKPFGVPT